jgi:hypothetical protein
MIYSIILYLILILPISINSYKIDGSKWLLIKILNSLITLYVFVLLSGNLFRLIQGFSDDSYLLMKNVPFGVNLILTILYTLLSIIAGVQVIKLAFRKGSARVLFIKLIPFLWIFHCVQLYYGYVALYFETPPLYYLVFSGVLHVLLWLGILLLYNSKKFKDFFSSVELLHNLSDNEKPQ